jgi:thiol-disulfide isomerase/thioredoxin
MKKFTSPLMLLFTTLIFAQTTNYNVGDIVDDFTVTDIYGVEHNLYEYTDAGKHIYLDFFFDTCGPCQTWQPTFSEFYDKYGCNG